MIYLILGIDSINMLLFMKLKYKNYKYLYFVIINKVQALGFGPRIMRFELIALDQLSYACYM